MKKVKQIIELLKQEYPEPKCELDYSAPHELLIAARLSAQCTDKRVNLVTPALFEKYRSVREFAAADVSDIEQLVKTCGLFKTKAADIAGMCVMLCEAHGGVIPCEMDELLKLPGVGRKTANLIRGELFSQPAIVADTHVMRLSGRLGLVNEPINPLLTEKTLTKLIPAGESMAFCHRLVLHGRRVCKARSPGCGNCCLKNTCNHYKNML